MGDGEEGAVRRQAAGGAEPNVMAQRRRAPRGSVEAMPEPVTFCRRCLHDFDVMPDGRCGKCRGSYRLLCPGCSREFRGTDEGRSKFDRHKCDRRRIIEGDAAREACKTRPLSGDFSSDQNPLFSGSDDEEAGGCGGGSRSGSRGGSCSGSRIGSRAVSRAGSRGSSRQPSPTGSLTQITIDTATAVAAQLRDPFAEALTAPEESTPTAATGAGPRAGDGIGTFMGLRASFSPVAAQLPYVSEAELIGGGIAYRSWDDGDDDGVGRFKKSVEGTGSQASGIGAKGTGKWNVKGHSKVSPKWADDSVVLSVENVDFELPKTVGPKRGPRACCMRYSLCVMIAALVLALLGLSTIIAIEVTGGDVSFLNLGAGASEDEAGDRPIADGSVIAHAPVTSAAAPTGLNTDASAGAGAVADYASVDVEAGAADSRSSAGGDSDDAKSGGEGPGGAGVAARRARTLLTLEQSGGDESGSDPRP
mmetsp:Transcript_21793/g.53854  ORF Transcript_21793/g.53854 Transcript_21793/m.53854 type:complete len:476 (-) Transcript_21793:382-1809(-)